MHLLIKVISAKLPCVDVKTEELSSEQRQDNAPLLKPCRDMPVFENGSGLAKGLTGLTTRAMLNRID
jgi:hypothetical protein